MCYNESKDEPCPHCGRRRPCHRKDCPHHVEWVFVPHIAPGPDEEGLALREAASEVHFWLRVRTLFGYGNEELQRAQVQQLYLQMKSYNRAQGRTEQKDLWALCQKAVRVP